MNTKVLIMMREQGWKRGDGKRNGDKFRYDQSLVFQTFVVNILKMLHLEVLCWRILRLSPTSNQPDCRI